MAPLPTSSGNAMKYLSASMMFAAFSTLVSTVAYSGDTTGRHRFYEVRGAKLYTQTYGHGAPIIFLHGGTVFFDNSFANQRDYFATYRTVIGIDQRGHGHSPDGPDHWMTLVTKCYEMWLEPIVIEPADLKAERPCTKRKSLWGVAARPVSCILVMRPPAAQGPLVLKTHHCSPTDS